MKLMSLLLAASLGVLISAGNTGQGIESEGASPELTVKELLLGNRAPGEVAVASSRKAYDDRMAAFANAVAIAEDAIAIAEAKRAKAPANATPEQIAALDEAIKIANTAYSEAIFDEMLGAADEKFALETAIANSPATKLVSK